MLKNIPAGCQEKYICDVTSQECDNFNALD